jgi:peptide-methionine (S)-S-oxide reductase
MRFRFASSGFLTGAVLVLAGVSGAQAADIQKVVFAGGCFWCTESDFDKVDGVVETISGYANGNIPNPTYEQVTRGGTGYIESVEVSYDADLVSYEDLLEVYWPSIDPLDGLGQFCDKGDSYRPAIFYGDDAQRAAAEQSEQLVADAFELDGIAVAIEALTNFYPAEDYHQDYYEKNPIRYNYYRWGCGRDARLEEVWGDTKRASLFD